MMRSRAAARFIKAPLRARRSDTLSITKKHTKEAHLKRKKKKVEKEKKKKAAVACLVMINGLELKTAISRDTRKNPSRH